MGVAFHFAREPTTQWRAPLGIALIFPAFMIFVAAISPESPRWLLLNGRSEEARVVIYKLHASKSSHEFADQEFQEMVLQTDIDSRLEHSWVSSDYRGYSLLANVLAAVHVHEAFISEKSGHYLLAMLCRSIHG